MRGVFVLPERCIGCRQCELACALEHSASRELAGAFAEDPVPRSRVHVAPGPVPSTAYPNQCRHCDPAPCQQVCPTAAIARDAAFGLVLVDPGRCIGCAMCAVVCPFDVITFHPAVGGPGPEIPVAVKCDGCVERRHRGAIPACVEVCKVGALVFGDVNELVAAGRVDVAGTVLAAAGVTRAPAPGVDPLGRWRSWGEETVSIAGSAASDGSSNGAGRPRAARGAASEGGAS
ncbi:MAG TPA: 4Fe-4S dicluster domain-containing protein [Acidimicrobiia bacterium]|nr:4Fe-4S dicluster domain-containing protein [Acidimicrobiia bacterium]